VDYELDSEDEDWLDNYNSNLDEEQKVREITLEGMIDFLEKEAFSKSRISPPNTETSVMIETLEYLQDSDCCVCLDGLCEDVNQIVFL